MTNNLFVGGFPYETTQDELSKFFATCGKVVSVKILTDKETGRSRGIGFVVMSTEAEAKEAIAKLNGQVLGARKIFVDIAKPQEKRPGGFGPRPGGPKPAFGAGAGYGPKPGFGADKKPWSEKPSWDESKRGGAGDKRKKKWDDRGEGGGGKRRGKPNKFGDDDFDSY